MFMVSLVLLDQDTEVKRAFVFLVKLQSLVPAFDLWSISLLNIYIGNGYSQGLVMLGLYKPVFNYSLIK